MQFVSISSRALLALFRLSRCVTLQPNRKEFAVQQFDLWIDHPFHALEAAFTCTEFRGKLVVCRETLCMPDCPR